MGLWDGLLGLGWAIWGWAAWGLWADLGGGAAAGLLLWLIFSRGFFRTGLWAWGLRAGLRPGPWSRPVKKNTYWIKNAYF